MCILFGDPDPVTRPALRTIRTRASITIVYQFVPRVHLQYIPLTVTESLNSRYVRLLLIYCLHITGLYMDYVPVALYGTVRFTVVQATAELYSRIV